ncbi:hypothetical protein [Phaeovulum sp.]|uniref:hypothetical protein n=1 Tax=Phaeovulum sp. TaxID=2934796 RepID=UPI0027317FD5|nr:hypothetical protein [Phaeovulum sp.]MDP1668367.1 hypothetical protein [Phaeovulum sp.]MDP3860385.1 hypothetical protein [Phaeovulum sp.]MDZ4120138.1 hypothetical protein [Phaeovulum sp.]
MKFKPIFAMTCVLAMFGTTPALAGAPDNPGAGGQAVKAAVASVKAAGFTWGEIVSEFVQTTDGTLGEQVSAINEPNPANDNGGGND